MDTQLDKHVFCPLSHNLAQRVNTPSPPLFPQHPSSANLPQLNRWTVAARRQSQGPRLYIFSFTDAQSLTKSWVWRQGVHPQQYPEGGFIYMSGIYETTLMLFGNGDATSNAEMGTSIMVLVSGAVLNALLFGKINQIVAKINDSDTRKNRKMEIVHQQMKTLNVRERKRYYWCI